MNTTKNPPCRCLVRGIRCLRDKCAWNCVKTAREIARGGLQYYEKSPVPMFGTGDSLFARKLRLGLYRHAREIARGGSPQKSPVPLFGTGDSFFTRLNCLD